MVFSVSLGQARSRSALVSTSRKYHGSRRRVLWDLEHESLGRQFFNAHVRNGLSRG